MAPQAEGFLRHSSFCNVSGEKVGRRPYVGVLGGGQSHPPYKSVRTLLSKER